MEINKKWQEMLDELDSSILPDGGMPGSSETERAFASAAALVEFIESGSVCRRGRYKARVRKLVEFLEASKVRNPSFRLAISFAREATPLAREWAKNPSQWKGNDVHPISERLFELALWIAKESDDATPGEAKYAWADDLPEYIPPPTAPGDVVAIFMKKRDAEETTARTPKRAQIRSKSQPRKRNRSAAQKGKTK